ncbi:MAG: UDP-N-acetylmuramoyl-tripeptide--D-alanyl-D-alanine ligase [Opitutaceae bacterium]|nr:UDP-N-acetylmuramoyl-tripeptide--D-alanyl-D-alanine ligase [Verrucomicrobiales bacterium]
MEARSLKFIAEATGGTLINGAPEVTVQSIATDSRQVKSGDFFIALAGDRFDAHAFLPAVAAQRPGAILACRERVPVGLTGCPLILVDDTRRALGRLAAVYRREFVLPVVAVGGSNGKTTTKDLIASVLRQRWPIVASEASFNNDIGVPLTLLKLDATHRAAVLEVGTNHPGELAPLLQIIQPRFGVITSIGREHLEFFGDLAGVILEEGVMGEALPADGRLFVNGEGDWLPGLVARSRAPVVRVGFQAGMDLRGDDVRLDSTGVTFQVKSAQTGIDGTYRVNLLGRHQVSNALLAIGVGAELGLTREEIGQGLRECQPPKMRLQVWDWNGVTMLDDAYNANADSMLAALQTLHDLPCSGRRVAVLGDMAELGAETEPAHIEVGRRTAELGIDHLIAVGRMAGTTAAAARNAGLSGAVEVAEVGSATALLRAMVRSGDTVLLKASRSTRLEQLGEALRKSVIEKN